MTPDYQEKAAYLYALLLSANSKDAIKLLRLELEMAFVQGESNAITEANSMIASVVSGGH